MDTPALDQLMGAYFHEDWDAVGTEDDVVRLFLIEDPELAARLPDEIEHVLATCPDEASTTQYLETRHPAYDPTLDFGSHRSWLEAIASRAGS